MIDHAQALEDKIRANAARIGTIGLGYVGLPLSVEFAAAGLTVTGFDVSPEKVEALNAGRSYIKDVPEARLAPLVREGRLKASRDFEGLAACDAVMVGIGTVLKDDPQLTVREVPGANPMRVILDSDLRIPHDARILNDEASTVIFTSHESDPAVADGLRSRGIRVEVVGKDFSGLSVPEILERLASMGVRSLLVEGGSSLITSFLGSGMTDRLIVSIAPTVLGAGTETVSDLGSSQVTDGIRLSNRSLVTVEDDLILAWDVDYAA